MSFRFGISATLFVWCVIGTAAIAAAGAGAPHVALGGFVAGLFFGDVVREILRARRAF